MTIRQDAERRDGLGGKTVELVVGVALGLALGLTIAYLLVIVAGGKDASQISNGPEAEPPMKSSTNDAGRSGRAAP
jgi:hypothetical protein